MRILYFHQHFNTPAGHTGTRSYEMAIKLVSRGHKVTMICGTSAMTSSGLTNNFIKKRRDGYIKGIKVVEFDIKYSNYQSFIVRILTFLNFVFRSSIEALQTKKDLCFATSTPLTAGIPAIIQKIVKKTPFVFEVRDLWPELPCAMGLIRNPVLLLLMSILEKTTYYFSDGCIGLAPGILNGINKFKHSPKNVIMIPNGADTDIFKPNKNSNYQLPFKTTGKFIAVFTGAHGTANGLFAAIEAALILENWKHNNIIMLFVGDGKLKPDLITKVKNHNLSNCHFLPPIPKVKMPDLLNTVQIGMQLLANVPAFYQGTSPNKFFDYISCGLPVITNYPGWIADIIKETNCGIVVPPDNPESFAKKLVNLSKNPKSLNDMSKNARAVALDKFNRDNLSLSFCKFLEKTCDNQNPLKQSVAFNS